MSAEVSKAIRQELKKVLPGIKFSVKTPHYGTVDIRWQDAVTRNQVEKIAHKYEYGHFDGMTDSYEYSNPRDDVPQCKFVFCVREYSEKAIEQAINATKDEFHLNGVPATPAMYNNGELYNIYVVGNSTLPHWSLQHQVSEKLSAMTF